jgi:hypothetical protein
MVNFFKVLGKVLGEDANIAERVANMGSFTGRTTGLPFSSRSTRTGNPLLAE